MQYDSPKRPQATQPTDINEFTVGFARILGALGINTQLELADLLEIRQSSISDAKRRGVIPGEWCLKLYKSHRLNPRWLYDGLPPVFLAKSDSCESCLPGGQPSFLLKYPENALLAVFVQDASMEPGIRKYSFVGLNSCDRAFLSGALVGIHLPLEGLAIRRIENDAKNEKAVIKADNPFVPVQRLPMDDCLERIAGRVAWIMSCI